MLPNQKDASDVNNSVSRNEERRYSIFCNLKRHLLVNFLAMLWSWEKVFIGCDFVVSLCDELHNRYCTCRRQRSSDMVRSCLERASSSSSSFQPSPSPGEKTSDHLSQREQFRLGGVWKQLLHRSKTGKDCRDKTGSHLVSTHNSLDV